MILKEPIRASILDRAVRGHRRQRRPGLCSPLLNYAIANNGSLTLVNGTAVLQATSSIPLLDASVSGDGQFLYVVDVGRGTIDAFRIGPGASLSAIGSTSGLPAGAGGLAAS